MLANRAAQRAEREAASRRAEQGSRHADRRRGEVPVAVGSSDASEPPASAFASELIADHTDCEATIGALRLELVNLEERHDNLVLSRWRLGRKYEHSIGRMRSHDPAGVASLVERLAD